MNRQNVILGDSPYPPVPKTCDLCGGELEVTCSKRDDTGAALAQASFVETYQCQDRPVHTGKIEGHEADPPAKWGYIGCVSEP
jgi:hypothetical protein